MTIESYALAANAVLLLHAVLVLFVLGGQVLILCGWCRGWCWTRNLWFRLSHLTVIGLVMLETWVGFACPLTVFENWLRWRAGQASYDDIGFVGQWIQTFLFYSAPPWVFAALYTGLALLVLASFVLYPPRCNVKWKDRSKRAE